MSNQLRKQLADKQAEIQSTMDEMSAVIKTAEVEQRELNDDDQKLIEDCEGRIESLEGSVRTLQSAIDTFDRIQTSRVTPEAFGESSAPQSSGSLMQTSQSALPVRLKAQRSKVYENSYDAYQCGMWLAGAIGNRWAREWCRERGMAFQNAMEEGTPNLGGYSVPDPMAATIIRLVEEYGVFRQFSRNAVMSSDTLDVPTRAGGVTVEYPAENTLIPESDVTMGQINLVAKKYAARTLVSTELNEDSVISVTDLVTTEMAWAFARAEDTNSFLGDGTAPFASITGIESALQAGSKVVSAGGDWASVTLDNFHEMVAKCPQYSGLNPRWYINSYGYHASIVPLLVQLGGSDIRQTEAGGEMMLLGYPVTYTQVLPGATAPGLSKLLSVFGDLNLGSYLGTRRAITIRILTERYADQDSIGLVATMRSDTNIHDVGDATNSGCIVGLYTAAT